MTKWNIDPSGEYQRDAAKYEKKRPREYAAILANLASLMDTLEVVNSILEINCNFFSSEGNGLFRVSEAGQGANLQPTRLYLTLSVEGSTVRLRRLLPKGQPKQQSEQINQIKASIRAETNANKKQTAQKDIR